MRLTCPNCAAAYEVAPELIPTRGGHVQCSACHTRWFVRGGLQALGREDDIIRRLEARRPGPRAVPEPDAQAEADKDFVWESREDPDPPAATADAASASEAAAAATVPNDPEEPVPPPEAADELVPSTSVAGASAEAPLPDANPPAATPSEAPPSGVAPEPAPPKAAKANPAPGRNSRFALGMLCAIVLCAIAVALYLGTDRLAEAVPGAALLIDGYARTIDDLRGRIAGQ